jgi:hypothetical protein
MVYVRTIFTLFYVYEVKNFFVKSKINRTFVHSNVQNLVKSLYWTVQNLIESLYWTVQNLIKNGYSSRKIVSKSAGR